MTTCNTKQQLLATIKNLNLNEKKADEIIALLKELLQKQNK